MLKTDKLEYRVYARHGDSCGIDPQHHDTLGCALGHKANDYVLVAQFAYLTEALDYCEELNRRKVSVKLRKPHFGPRVTSDYSDYPADPCKFHSKEVRDAYPVA